MRKLHDLTGRVALITGGGSGLGRAMAWGLACYGAALAIVDRDKAAAEACAAEIAGGLRSAQPLPSQADVSNEGRRRAAVAEVLAELGHVDVLLNNAGHNIRKPLLDYTCEEFELLARRARARHLPVLPGRRPSHARTQVRLDHQYRLRCWGTWQRQNVAPYAAAKAAIVQLTKVLALELAGTGGTLPPLSKLLEELRACATSSAFRS